MKRALIIGASSGIGKELAKLLVEDGYKVIITGRREKLLEEISFDASDLSDKKVVVNAEYVNKYLGDLVADEDLSRYIL